MMKYKGYAGYVIYDDEAKIFHGEVLGINDVVTFQGKSVNELEKAFRDSVDDYLEWCKEVGKEPDKTYSGNINLRITPDLHSKIAKAATMKGVSINTYILEKLRNSR